MAAVHMSTSGRQGMSQLLADKQFHLFFRARRTPSSRLENKKRTRVFHLLLRRKKDVRYNTQSYYCGICFGCLCRLLPHCESSHLLSGRSKYQANSSCGLVESCSRYSSCRHVAKSLLLARLRRSILQVKEKKSLPVQGFEPWSPGPASGILTS